MLNTGVWKVGQESERSAEVVQSQRGQTFTLAVLVVPSVLQIAQDAVTNQCIRDRESCLEVLVTWAFWFYLDFLEEVYYI